ncbi:MAG: hypothetical protein WD081_08095 [Gammaproteobacteria bacterium]
MRYLVAVLVFLISAPAFSQAYLGHGDLSPERPEPDGFGIFGFGQSALRVDDTLVVGAASSFMASGTVLFHERVGGVWVEQQQLVAPDGEFDDQFFGHALVRIGDDLFVGAPHTEVADEPYAGTVYRVTRDAGSGEWSVVETIEPPTPAENGLFGYALSVAGGTLFVGSPHAHHPNDGNLGWRGNGSNGGRVYAYEVDGGSGAWSLVDTLQGDTDLPGDAFGAALAADAVRLVVGAPGEGASGEGAIYAFGTADLGTAPVRFADDSGVAGLVRFGRAVSMAGDRVLVGAEGDGAGNTAPQGAAHLIEFGAGGATRVATFEEDGAHYFGWSVLMIDDQQVLVGAPVEGVVYHYLEGDDGWSLVQQVTEPVQSSFSDDYFGEVLVLTEGELFVGAPSSLHHWGMSSGRIPLPSFSQSGKLFEVPLVAPPLADLTLTTNFPAMATEETEVELEIRVASDPDQAVSAAFVLVRLYMDIVASPDDCFEIGDFIFRCELGAIGAGEEGAARFTIAVPAENSMMTTSLHVYAGSEFADPDTTDNAADRHLIVLPEAPEPPPPVSSGGGSFGWFGALFLLAMLKSRIRLRRSAPCSARTCVSPDSIPNLR